MTVRLPRPGRLFWIQLLVNMALAAAFLTALAAPRPGLISTVAIASAGALLLLAMGLAYRWSRRITKLSDAARTLSRGDLSTRLEIGGRDEPAILAAAVNRMRHRLARQLQIIDHQRRTFESLLGQLREGVIVADAHGRIVLLNDEARRLLQLPLPNDPNAGVGMLIEQCVPQRRLQEMLQYEKSEERRSKMEAVSLEVHPPTIGHGPSPSSAASVQESRLQIETSSGPRFLLARAFDIELPAGRMERRSSVSTSVDGAVEYAQGRMLMLTDVTELTRVMQVKADFAANASHELRTPLASIRAALETMGSINLADDSAAAERVLQIIDRHSRRMEEMVRDLLDLSRLESPTARFAPAELSPREVLAELHGVYAEVLAARSLHWETQIADECRSLVASPELLQMVLRNLLDNAVRFTDPGGHVRIRVWSDGGGACFEVADDGCGIPAADQQRVFERFFQVRRGRSGAERGTGLGLSIVRHAVAAMNGRVELQSEPGKGTTVRICLPQPGQKVEERGSK